MLYNIIYLFSLPRNYTIDSLHTNFVSPCKDVVILRPGAYTGCFTTLGHNCRRWFPRSLWSKKFI
jgi:hypothetical protein